MRVYVRMCEYAKRRFNNDVRTGSIRNTANEAVGKIKPTRFPFSYTPSYLKTHTDTHTFGLYVENESYHKEDIYKMI